MPRDYKVYLDDMLVVQSKLPELEKQINQILSE